MLQQGFSDGFSFEVTNPYDTAFVAKFFDVNQLQEEAAYQRIGEVNTVAPKPLSALDYSDNIIYGSTLSAGLIIYDIWRQQFEQMNVKRNPKCTCCGTNTYEFL